MLPIVNVVDDNINISNNNIIIIKVKKYSKNIKTNNKEEKIEMELTNINKDIKSNYIPRNIDIINKYYMENRDKKLEYQKKYNKEKADKIQNYNHEYYLKRRNEILEKAKTKIKCECGCEIQQNNMNEHKKTNKHLKYIENIRNKI